MERDGGKCKERYTFLRQSQGGKGPVPWTREEDKKILALVAQHGKKLFCLAIIRDFFIHHPNISLIFFSFRTDQVLKSGALLPITLKEEAESNAESAGTTT